MLSGSEMLHGLLLPGFTAGTAAGGRSFASFIFEESSLKYRRNAFSSAFVPVAEWEEPMFL